MPAADGLVRSPERVRAASHYGCMTMEPFPIAAHAPARAEPRHERVPPLRLDAQRHVIAYGATIAIRKNENEHDRREDEAQHEESDEDDSEYHGTTSRNQALQRLPENRRPATTGPATEARADAR